jgi:exodeoxyribonuclease VII large subunit
MKIENSVILKNPSEITKEKRDAYLKNFNKLEVLNPLLTLKRGYTLTKKDGKIISSSKDVKKDDELEIEFDDGKINTKVI